MLTRIIHHSRGASLVFRYHSAFASPTNTGSIRSVAENTVITNTCAIRSLSGELSRLRAREKITSGFHIPSSGHLRSLLGRKNLEVALLFLRFYSRGSSEPGVESGREKTEVIPSRTLIHSLFCLLVLIAAQSVLSGCADAPPTLAPPEETRSESTPHVLADCEPIDAGLTDADADELFNYPHVPYFDFYLPADEWEMLQVNARDEEYVAAALCFEDRFVGTVGLRFKGYYGSLYECFNEQDEMICPRLSLKVKFSEYDTEQRLFGLKRLNFHAYRYDDSRMKERLSYDRFRAMGIVAPRASWAVVRVNDESQGLYGMVEQVDGRFIADRWPDNPDGNLYKEVWPTMTTAGQVLQTLKTNEEDADVEAYLAFVEALETAEDSEVLSVLDAYLGLDYLARYMAVDDATANYDGITYLWTDGIATNNHNYYFYQEASDKFTLIPWDLESTFWINPDHAAPHWTEVSEDCHETYPYWDGLARAPGCDRVFRAMATDADRWRAAGRELLDGPFTVEAMRAAIDRHQAYIGDEARADPTPTVYSTFDGSVAGLRDVIPSMCDRFERLMAGTMSSE